VGSTKSHRRFLSTDSFFNDALLLECSPTSSLEGRDPDLFSCRKEDSRQRIVVSQQDDAMMDFWTQPVQPSSTKQRRSLSVIPSLLGLTSPGPESLKMPLSKPLECPLPSETHQEMMPSQTDILLPPLATICEKRVVQFAPYVTVREYEDVAVGDDVHLPNYGSSLRYGLPISLGTKYRTVRKALPPPVAANAASSSTSTVPLKVGKLRRSFESCRKLRPKQRFVILKEHGGYSEKELWKMQRDLTLKDRRIFFGGYGGNFDKELWKKQREKTLRDRRIFFLGQE
jgi:hypothetical protein